MVVRAILEQQRVSKNGAERGRSQRPCPTVEQTKRGDRDDQPFSDWEQFRELTHLLPDHHAHGYATIAGAGSVQRALKELCDVALVRPRDPERVQHARNRGGGKHRDGGSSPTSEEKKDCDRRGEESCLPRGKRCDRSH